jgi:hypothetical protein
MDHRNQKLVLPSKVNIPASKLILLDPAHDAAFNTFRVEKQTRATRKRAKFGPDRRREVEVVRRVGACLRCSVLRIPVSSMASKLGQMLIQSTVLT